MTKRWFAMVPVLLVLVAPGSASAQDARVMQGPRVDDGRYAVAPTEYDAAPARQVLRANDPELYRSPLRISLGPSMLTTGQGLGYGVGAGVAFGSGSVGGRLSVDWFRGEGGDGNNRGSRTGEAFGHYAAELTLDLKKSGPIHPTIGVGAAVLHIVKPGAGDRTGSAAAGAGIARLSLDYAFNLDDADVRLGAGVLAGLVGPRADEARDLNAYMMAGGHVVVGF